MCLKVSGNCVTLTDFQNVISSLGRHILPDLKLCSCYRYHFSQFWLFGESKNSPEKCVCFGEGKWGEREERKGPEKGGLRRDQGKKSNKPTPQGRPAREEGCLLFWSIRSGKLGSSAGAGPRWAGLLRESQASLTLLKTPPCPPADPAQLPDHGTATRPLLDSVSQGCADHRETCIWKCGSESLLRPLQKFIGRVLKWPNLTWVYENQTGLFSWLSSNTFVRLPSLLAPR